MKTSLLIAAAFFALPATANAVEIGTLAAFKPISTAKCCLHGAKPPVVIDGKIEHRHDHLQMPIKAVIETSLDSPAENKPSTVKPTKPKSSVDTDKAAAHKAIVIEKLDAEEIDEPVSKEKLIEKSLGKAGVTLAKKVEGAKKHAADCGSPCCAKGL